MKNFKKFFTVMLLSVGIFFGSQITNPPTTSAASTKGPGCVWWDRSEAPYVFTIDGVNYFLSRITTVTYSDCPYVVELYKGQSEYKCRWYFFRADYETFYATEDLFDDSISEKGYISRNPRAKKLAGIIYAYEHYDNYQYTSDE